MPQYLIDKRWKFLRHLNIRTIIDVGANEGQFLKEVYNIFPNAEFYSFEPLRDCFDKLTGQFKNNRRVHTFNFALGEEDGEIILSRSSASESSSILKMARLHKNLFPHTANLFEEKVKIKRLDDIFENMIIQDFILLKIDVQGAEEKVIRGAIQLLKKVNIIITEVSYTTLYEDQPLFKDILNLLLDHKFTFVGMLEQFVSPSTSAPLFADAIFVKKEMQDVLYGS
jgi:FkbM family methyltransferase